MEEIRGGEADAEGVVEEQAGGEAEEELWPPLGRRGAVFSAEDEGEWDAEGRWVTRDASGARLVAQQLGDGILRVTLLTPGTEAAPASFAVVGDVTPQLSSPDTKGGPRTEPRLPVGEGSGVRFGWGEGWAWAWIPAEPGAAYFGFGERTGALDRRGTRMTFWTLDVGPHTPDTDAMYQSHPVGMAWNPATGRTTGIFCDHPGLQRWDICRARPDAVCIAAQAQALDFYLFSGPTMAGVLAQYTTLTGRMPMPPRWALGFQQSRWSYTPASRVLDVAREFRRRNLPADTIYLDIDYMHGFRDFTFDPAAFPDPAGLMWELGDLGFRVVTILDPGVKRDRGYAVYDEMFRNRYYVKWPDGRPHVGSVWPGPCVFPDFFNPTVREWWGGLHTSLLDAGVAGIWDDMNEPVSNPVPAPTGTPDEPHTPPAEASSAPSETEGVNPGWFAGTFPPDVVHETGGGTRAHGEVHSAYGMQMARATAEGLDRLRPNARRFVLTRSGYAGVQRYAAVWTGDNQSWWEHLGMAVSMCQGVGMSGVPFVGADIGGFNGRCTGELYLRWLQFGTVMPLMRGHYNSGSTDGQNQEPWSFGPEIEAHARAALQLRYRLLPYLYSLFHEAATSGAPILRPLAWDFPHDPRGRTVDYEALCGPALLVAPVTRPGQAAQAVYLPAGSWMHFATGVVYTGGQDVLVPTPLDHFPLFVRGGCVIPLGTAAHNSDAASGGPVTLLAVPPARSGTRLPDFAWYEDNGSDLAYLSGDYRITPLMCARDGDGRIVIEVGPVTGPWQPPARETRLEVGGLDAAPASVKLNGRLTAHAWDRDRRRLSLALPKPGQVVIRVEIES
ncbi:MAG: TIM-barrel domain-containing protein [Chloroflexia bacterium]